jgi:hypothetical protein
MRGHLLLVEGRQNCVYEKSESRGEPSNEIGAPLCLCWRDVKGTLELLVCMLTLL